MDIHLPGYRLLAAVAHGDDEPAPAPLPGRATLWRAVREADGAVVAIKLFHPADAGRADREASIAADLGHAHIVVPIEVVTAGGAVAVVLPWAAGGTLGELVSVRRRLRWHEALTVLIPIADALSTAHERGLVHGDVSTANILFDDDGKPMLADFGAARALAEVGGEVAVTPTSVAPEVARGAEPDARSDLFSLGSVALTCLTGRPAWPAEDVHDVVIQSAAGQWPDLDEAMAPTALCEIVRRLLARDPADRGSAAQAAMDLRDVGAPEPVDLVARDGRGHPVAPEPATVVRPDALRPPGRDGSPVQRHRAPSHGPSSRALWRGAAVVAVAVVLIGGAVTAGWWWSGSGQASPTMAIPVAGAASTPADTTPTAGAPAVGDAGQRRGATGVNWRRLLTELDAKRSAALVQRDPRLLAQVYTAASASRAADEERIEHMADQGYHVVSAAHRVRSAVVVSAGAAGSAGTVAVDAVTSLPSYAILDDSGQVIGRTERVPRAKIRVTLHRSDGAYRISSIVAQ